MWGKAGNSEEAIRAITVAGGGDVISWERTSLVLLETRHQKPGFPLPLELLPGSEPNLVNPSTKKSRK